MSLWGSVGFGVMTPWMLMLDAHGHSRRKAQCPSQCRSMESEFRMIVARREELPRRMGRPTGFQRRAMSKYVMYMALCIPRVFKVPAQVMVVSLTLHEKDRGEVVCVVTARSRASRRWSVPQSTTWNG